MWLIDGTPALFTDLYELTMAQVYFAKGMDRTARFEVTVRRLPEHWGFFIMAGLAEVQSYLQAFRFSQADIAYLRSLGSFSEDFLEYLSDFKPAVEIRALPEGTAFFPNEPAIEVSGPIIDAQLLETYILNILGFSIVEATLAARLSIASAGLPIMDFGLRRCQGPIASLRAARAGQMAGFVGTSNVFAARLLDLPPSGTMAHSFIQAFGDEADAFHSFIDKYRSRSILLVDTYDTIEGIKTAAQVARHWNEAQGVQVRGIRIDSGDLAELSAFARDYLDENDLGFVKIFVSGDLDEYKIDDLVQQGSPIDGFGIGTQYGAACRAAAISIVYKIAEYDGRGLSKTSPSKVTRPGRKTITRCIKKGYERDVIVPFGTQAPDLLQPFVASDPIKTIQNRLKDELAALPPGVTALRTPEPYAVEFVDDSSD